MSKKISLYDRCVFINRFDIIADWDEKKNGDKTPHTISSSTKDIYWWKCAKCGFEWEKSVYSRSQSLSACPACMKKELEQRRIMKIKQARTSILDKYPEVAGEWDYEKNYPYKPNEISAGCNKKYAWICKCCGHHWEAVVASRTKGGTGCNICGQSKASQTRRNTLISSGGSLKEKFPRIADEWFEEKNGTLLPEMVTPYSNEKVWWKCIKGHTYQAVINSRTRRNCGCSICSKENKTSFPEQVLFYYIRKKVNAENRALIDGIEADIYIPSMKIAIEYNGGYYHRNKAKHDEKKKNYFNSVGIRLITVNETSKKDPIDKSDRINDTIYCVYDSQYSFLPHVLLTIFSWIDLGNIDVNIERDRVEIYEQYIISEKESSIAEKRPELLLEWDYEKNGLLRPEFLRSSSNKKVWWKCQNNHSYQAAIYSRYAGTGCKFCAGQVLMVGVNDLLSQNPSLASEWDYENNGELKPNDITVSNAEKVWWICKECSHRWQSSVAHRNNKRGCPQCSKKRVGRANVANAISKSGSFAENCPMIALEWDYSKNSDLRPEDYSVRSGEKVWWKCAICGHEWKAFISNRAKGHGCPKCAQKTIGKNTVKAALEKSGSIAESHPQFLELWDYEKNIDITPQDVSKGSHRKVYWKCDRGHSYSQSIANKVKGQGCPICSGQQILPGYNDLQTLYPKVVEELHPTKNAPFDAKYTSAGTNAKKWWRCSKCGHEWEARINKRTKYGQGCPVCKMKKMS